MEEVTSSRGISLEDTASILQSFIDTLDNDQGASSEEDAAKSSSVTTAAVTATTPRKTRKEIEEESILKQFDLLSKHINTGLVSDDTYERLKIIRDSLIGEATGRPLLPSQIKRRDIMDETDEGHDTIKNDEEGMLSGSRQFINELSEAEQNSMKQDEDARREAKRAKKEKKSAKKAKKEAKKEKREKRKAARESGGGDEKRIKAEPNIGS